MPRRAVHAASTRREAILDAALQVFLVRGLAGATLEEIRASAGASVGSLYHHFQGKADIAAALHARCLAHYQDGALGELWRHKDVENGVKALVRHHLRWIEANADEARYLFMQQLPGVSSLASAEVRELNRKFFGGAGKWALSVAPDLVHAVPVDVLVSMWIGPAHHYGGNWLAGRVRTPPAVAAAALAEAAWRGLLPYLGSDSRPRSGGHARHRPSSEPPPRPSRRHG